MKNFIAGDDELLRSDYQRYPGGFVYDKVRAGGLVINAFRPVFTLRGNLNVVSGDGKSESTAYRLGV